MKVRSLKFHHKLPHSSTSCLDLWLWLFARLRRVLKVVSIAIVWVCEERKTASEIFTFLFAICFCFCNKHFWHRTTQTYKNEKKRAGKTKLRWSRWGCLGRAVQFSCTWSCGATGTNQRAEEVIYHYWHWSCHHTNCALSTVSIARSTNPNLCVTPQQLCVQFMRHFWDTSVCLLQAAHLSSASILSLYSQFVLFFWSGLHFWFGRTCLLTLTHSQSWTFTALRLRLDEVFFMCSLDQMLHISVDVQQRFLLITPAYRNWLTITRDVTARLLAKAPCRSLQLCGCLSLPSCPGDVHFHLEVFLHFQIFHNFL